MRGDAVFSYHRLSIDLVVKHCDRKHLTLAVESTKLHIDYNLLALRVGEIPLPFRDTVDMLEIRAVAPSAETTTSRTGEATLGKMACMWTKVTPGAL